jgi:hypothetical protein
VGASIWAPASLQAVMSNEKGEFEFTPIAIYIFGNIRIEKERYEPFVEDFVVLPPYIFRLHKAK